MNSWLDNAYSHATTRWLQSWLREFLPALIRKEINSEEFDRIFNNLLTQRQLTTLTQQKNPRSNVVQALKSIDPNHPAIELVGLTTEQYQSLNEQQRGRLAERKTKFLTRTIAQTLVDRATDALESAEWSHVAAGLAVLIGRRISEILISEFLPYSVWSLQFSEMAKKGEKDNIAGSITIEIPTLAPADPVLAAIQRLQKGLNIPDLKRESISFKVAKRIVSQRYSYLTAAKCNELFGDLIPKRDHQAKLSTHLFRAVYATIAAYWFCPPYIPEYQFKAEIQGHFILTQEGKKLPSYRARAHYDDYAIATEDGNRDGRLGIKLGQLPGLQVLKVFQTEQGKAQGKEQGNEQGSQPLLQHETPTILIGAPSKPLHYLNHQMELEKDKTDSKTENSHESQDILDTETREDNIDKDIKGLDIESVRIQSREQTAPVPKNTAESFYLWEKDIQQMMALMANRGVLGSPAQVFHALLTAFEAQQFSQANHSGDRGSGLEIIRWFTIEIDRLRDRIATLEQECAQLKAEQRPEQTVEPASDNVAQLKAENQRLTAELQQTYARLQGIQQLLGMEVVPPDPPVTLPIETSRPVEASGQAEASDSLQLSEAPGLGQSPRRATTRSRRQETVQKIHQVVDAMIAWNSAQDHPDQMLRVSIPSIKAIAAAMGANYQPAIQQALKERAAELEALHSRLLLGTRHNASVKDKNDILQTIARDYLALENWRAVHYSV